MQKKFANCIAWCDYVHNIEKKAYCVKAFIRIIVRPKELSKHLKVSKKFSKTNFNRYG